MQQINVLELASWLADTAREQPLLLDVREPSEYAICHIEGALLMPMQSIPARCAELDSDTEIVCICHHGGRSMQVASYLERQGFTRLSNLTGGVHAWAQQVDRSMPIY